MIKKILYILFVLVLISVAVFAYERNSRRSKESNNEETVTNNLDNKNEQQGSGGENPPIFPDSNPAPVQELRQPISDFKARVTKKPFGIYVTPSNSPVSPEKFTGYHTGADVEYTDITSDVPVFAIADGKISLARTAEGYGGVFILQVKLNGKDTSVVYGHIRPSTLPSVGASVKKGQQLGLLGKGFTSETDGERKHLHFGILSDARQDIKGYVQTKQELSGWQDPVNIF